VTLATLLVLTATPSRADACERSDLLGRVKSVIVTEALVDPLSGKIGEPRLAFRTDVSSDGGIVEMTVYAPGPSAEPASKSTAHFESGRPVREVETVNGKAVSTSTCSYDAQGRLVEARTQSEKGERSMVETYEYGSGFIRRRARILGQWKVMNQTLDALGRVVKEVFLDEARSTVEQTIEFTYSSDRQEQCVVSFFDPRRHCSTTIRDSHGNEIEFLTEGETRKTTFEYDSVGNWISQRKRVTTDGPRAPDAAGTRPTLILETIVQRKIEYW
jgi:hypothetical protein